MKLPTRQVDSVMDPVSESLAGAYADALLGQVPSDVEAEEVAGELDGLVRLLDEIEGFEGLLTASLLSSAERCSVVRRIFHGRVSEPVEAVLNVMAQAGRMGLLRVLRRVFRSALYRRQGKRELTVTTAVPLGREQREKTIRGLAETLGCEPVVTFNVDEGLIAGMAVRMGDHVYDASVRAELAGLEDRLRREIHLEPPKETGRKPSGTDDSKERDRSSDGMAR
ncbi:MAG: ATP synthase F1 subunit delta [Phycisphaerae bacterium]